jgi:RNA polymerase sigma-70 factor (ECF subfamily)
MGEEEGDVSQQEAQWRIWMTAAQRGDAQAYELLLHALVPPLRGFVRRRLSDPSAAEDVVQAVLLSIHRARHTWRAERPFGPWWRAIARNAVIDAARRRGRRAAREVPLAADHEVFAADWVPDAATEELSPELRGALEQLSPAQREAVELLHVEELSVAEAAARAGTTPGALKVRAHRGVAALRRLLGRESG